MRKIFSYDRIIIKKLFSCDNYINLYDFHTIYRLSPAQIADTLALLRDHEAVKVDDNRACLTNKGRIWVVKNRKLLFFLARDRAYRQPKPTVFLKENSEAYHLRPKRIGMKSLVKVRGHS